MISADNVVAGGGNPRGSDRSDLVDPCTGTTIGDAPVTSPTEVASAAASAREAGARWRGSTPAARQRALLRLADLVESRADTFVATEQLTTGKPTASTRDEEVLAAVDHLRFFAGLARSPEGLGAAEYLDGHTSYVRREPVGVTGHLLPFNYPLLMAVWKAAPALATGNAVILKPAEATPLSAVLLAETAAEVLPPGVLSVLCGGPATGRALTGHVDVITVTGSSRAGVDVASSAATSVTRTQLELGGNAAAVVFPDVDPAVVAREIAEAAFFNAGQDCTAITRVVAHESLVDELTTALAATAEATAVGPPARSDAFHGPLITRDHFHRTLARLARLPPHVDIRAGGRRLGDTGFFLTPTVLTGVRPDDEVVRAELFAPVLTVQPFGAEAEAVALANGVDQGLTASVWTHDHDRVLRLVAALDVGCVWVNTHMRFAPEMPHGGVKASGYGSDLSRYALDEYTRVKHVMHRIGPARD